MAVDATLDTGSIRVEIANISDVPSMVVTHQTGFPGFFLTFLGPAFLKELYLATLTDSDGIGFVVRSQKNGISGFVTGTSQPAGFYRRLLVKRWWRFGLASTRALLKRPSIIPRLLRALSMPNQVTHRPGRGTLMSIVVHPALQGQKIGQALVSAFLDEATARGLRQVDLTTDRDNNEATNSFYQKLGFVCEHTFMTPEGRAMNEYVIDLPGQAEPTNEVASDA
ncbi:MAG: GNAT family N-acetyltransferase [Chloroflexi bacterium]|nr:GNAT family N-acetyltransferase [Chloroflexota bacterium]